MQSHDHLSLEIESPTWRVDRKVGEVTKEKRALSEPESGEESIGGVSGGW